LLVVFIVCATFEGACLVFEWYCPDACVAVPNARLNLCVRVMFPLPLLLLLDVRLNFMCHAVGVRLLLCALQLVIISCLSCVWEENSYLPPASLPAGRRLRQGICQVREKRQHMREKTAHTRSREGFCEAVGFKR
jgi:hypothetical protein